MKLGVIKKIMQVDHSIVESFAQGGRTCISSRVYPTKAIYENAQLFLFNNATHANVTASLNIWQMDTAYRQQQQQPPPQPFWFFHHFVYCSLHQPEIFFTHIHSCYYLHICNQFMCFLLFTFYLLHFVN